MERKALREKIRPPPKSTGMNWSKTVEIYQGIFTQILGTGVKRETFKKKDKTYPGVAGAS